MDSKQQNENQEIDLSLISKKIGNFFESISMRIFRSILFIKKNKFTILGLFIAGAGLGMYLDTTIKKYDHQIIVNPNFNSTDYLYSKIHLIESKVFEGDTAFLKNVVGIQEPKKINAIIVEPIADVYKFIENKPENFELIKLMAENGDIKKIIEDNLTSKNYASHVISFRTDKKTDEEKTIKPLMNYLNDSEYYGSIQKAVVKNIKDKMAKNDSIIRQIDGFLNTFSNTMSNSPKSDKLVYYNENTQLNEVIKTKEALITEQANHRVELINLDKIIKESSITLNVKNNTSVNGKLKLVLPVLFILLFLLLSSFRSYYKRQLTKGTF